jgi:hypothetical protein
MTWISVEDKLPEDDSVGLGIVLVMNCKWAPKEIKIARYYKSKDVFVWDKQGVPHPVCLDVTHWLPIPDNKQLVREFEEKKEGERNALDKR